MSLAGTAIYSKVVQNQFHTALRQKKLGLVWCSLFYRSGRAFEHKPMASDSESRQLREFTWPK